MFILCMFILCITSDSEVLVKFCCGILKIIANVHKFWLNSRYFLVFQVISRLWQIETDFYTVCSLYVIIVILKFW